LGDAIVHLQNELTAGRCSLDVMWPFDPVHPDDPGYEKYFEAVRMGFEQAVREERVCRFPEKPVFSDKLVSWRRIILVDRKLPAGWQRTKTYRTSLWFDGLASRWMGDVAMCNDRDGQRTEPLRIEFEGSLVGVFGEMDENGLSFRVRVDGKPLKTRDNQQSETWEAHCRAPGRLFFWRLLASDLEPGRHVLEIQPQFSAGNEKGQLRIESVCVAGAPAMGTSPQLKPEQIR
jgi:hypothetical protein